MSSNPFSTRFLLHGTAVYTFLGFLGPASRLFVFPVLVRYLTPTDYGLIALTWTVVAVLSLVLPLGLDAAFNRMYFDYKRSPQLLRKYRSAILCVLLACGGTVWMLLELAGPWLFRVQFSGESFQYVPFGRIALLMALGTSIQNLALAYYRSSLQPMRFLFLSVTALTLTLVMEMGAVLVLGLKAEGILWARTIAAGAVSGWILLDLLRGTGLRWSWRLLRPSFQYGLPMLVYLLLAFIYMSYDRVLIENFLGLEAVALYSAAFTLASMIELATTSLQSATYPSIYHMLRDGQFNPTRVGLILRIMGLGVLITSVGILAISPAFFVYLTRPEYLNALPFVPLLLAGLFFRYLFIVYTLPIFYLRTKVNRTIWLNVVCSAVLVLGNILLLPRIGLWGAPIAVILARATQFLLAAWYYRQIGIPAGIILKLGWIKWAYMLFFLYLMTVQWLPAGPFPEFQLRYAMPLVLLCLLLGLHLSQQWRRTPNLKAVLSSL